MHSAVETMLKAYRLESVEDKKNALKEIVQEIALLGLYRSGFFSKAAFYGGTALRIFYGLDRFSEDLDFSLMEADTSFQISKYTNSIQAELGAFGFEMKVEEKVKSNDSAIKSAFIKGGTEIQLFQINSIKKPVKGVHANEQIKIKLEVDTNPPAGAEYEVKYQLNPVPFSVRLFTPESLFAGKMHALLCRSWGQRVKGRDFYDYLWYLSQSIELDLEHLTQRMVQTGHLVKGENLDKSLLIGRLKERFSSINFEQAKSDVLPFIKNSESLGFWSEEFFTSVTLDKLKIK